MTMKLLKYSGYLLYTTVVVLFLLWYKFPAEALKTRIEQDLNSMTPALHWAVQEISLLPPFDIQLRHISISGKEDKKPLLTVKTMNLRPDVFTRRKKDNITAKYTINLLNGTVTGRLGLAPKRSTLEYDGHIKEVKIDTDRLTFIEQEYRRTVAGILSGNFSGSRELRRKTHTLQGRFTFAHGAISLQEPVLGMKQLDFDRIETELNFDTGIIALSRGRITSPSFAAEFQGDLHTAAPCPLSRIQLSGSFQPRPEFTASVDSPRLVHMLKKEMQKGGLPFTVSGLLKEPGIVFTGLPAALNRMTGLRNKKPQRLPEERSR